MRKIDFNDNWTYGRLGEENGTLINIPHDAMLHERRSPNSLGGINSAWFEGHDYWYKKTFESKPEFFAGKAILEFEGVYKDAEILLNGQKLAYRPYGYSNFYVDITDAMEEGTNEVTVLARNSDQPNSRWYSGSGIYRPVSLHILPEKHIELDGIRIKTISHDKGQIEITVRTNEPGQGTIEIFDGDGLVLHDEQKLSGNSSFIYEVPNARLWSPSTPNLYQCKVTFEGDQDVATFGIRTIECDAENGLRINGEKIILRGACVHHDNGLLGACAHDFSERRKVKLMQKAGYNALRSAHNPCSKTFLKACDELGMLVVDEFVDCWYIHKTRNDYVKHFEGWWQADLLSMVEKDYNHPSVIMYSIGNEVSETAQKRGIELTGTMTEYLHNLDETRPVTCGINVFFNFLSSLGFGVYTDKKADKEAENLEKGKNKKEPVGSEFYNKLAGVLGDKVMKMGATLYGSDVKTRDAFARLDVAGYNYGILRYKKDLKKYPNRVILGTETFCKDAARFMELAETNPALIGDFVWAGMDYLGEVGIGSHEYKDYAKDFSLGVGWVSAGSGRLDLTGQELAEALYTKVAFGLEPIHIAVVPVDNYGNSHSPSAWKMTNARSSWSWNGHNGKLTRIEVYARAHSIALLINGKLVEKKPAGKELRTYFKAEYYDGSVEAIAYDEHDRVIASTSLETAGNETVLNAYPEDVQIGAGDLAYVRFKYTDANGTLKPLARGKIDLTVKGGKLLAFGHGCPYNEDGYLNDFANTYYGEALAIIKPESSSVRLMASSRFGDCSAEIDVVE